METLQLCCCIAARHGSAAGTIGPPLPGACPVGGAPHLHRTGGRESLGGFAKHTGCKGGREKEDRGFASAR